MKYTTKEFGRYESVRRSGVTNMFDIKTVGIFSGLSREQIIDIMENYDQYQSEYELENS